MFATASRGQAQRILGLRPLAMVLALALAALSLGVVAPPSQAAEVRSVALRSLVVSSGDPATEALAAELERQAIPYTLVTVGEAGRPTIDAGFLADQAAGRGRFQAVFLPNQAGGGAEGRPQLSPSELTALAAYEAEYGIRQVNGYDYPSPAVGLTATGTAGALDGSTVTVTGAGLSGPFSYLTGTVAIEDSNPSITETYGVLAEADPAMPASQSFTPLLTTTLGGTTGTIAGVFAHGGREELVFTASYNWQMQWFNVIAEGIVSWATRGIALGYNRNYLNAHIDDVLNDDTRWNAVNDCTPPDAGCENVPMDSIRMTVDDVDRLIDWQNRTGLKLDMTFNAVGSVQREGDPLTAELLANKGEFNWLNHTYSHQFLGCIRMAQSPDEQGQTWRCANSPADVADVDNRWEPDLAAEQGPDGLWYASPSVISSEVQLNLAWAAQNELPNFDPKELVTGEHGGLKRLPQQPVDNPFLGPALSANRIDYTGSDASRESEPRLLDGSTVRTVPRHPMNIFFNVGRYLDEVDEYNWIYTSVANGGSGICEDNPTTSTCITPLPADDPEQAEASFNSYILPIEVRNALKFVLTNDPRPFYAHQSNLAEDGLLYPVLDGVINVYNSTFKTNTTPLVQASLTGQHQAMTRLSNWRAEQVGASDGYVDSAGVVHIPNSSVAVPVTVPTGSTGASLAPYGGALSGWLDDATTITLPIGAGGYLPTAPDAPTGVNATPGDTTAKVTWTAPGSDGGSPISGYVVRAFVEDSTENSLTQTTTAGGTELVVTGLTNGTRYRFDVAAVNGVGTGAASAKSPLVTPAGLPGAPTAVTAVLAATDPTLAADEARITWTAPTETGGVPITGYEVHKYDSSVPTDWVNAGPVAASSTSFVAGGLTKYNSWAFRVRAVNAAGAGAWSPNADVYLPPTAPGAPTGVTGTAGEGLVELTWTAPLDTGGRTYVITRYVVRVYEGDSAAVFAVHEPTGAGTSFVVPGLTNGTGYRFDVAAVNDIGTGAASVKSEVVRPAFAPPGAPTGVKGVAGPGAGEVTLSWAAAPVGAAPVEFYVVQKSPSTGDPVWEGAGSATASATTLVVSGLAGGSSWVFQVRAVNAGGEGAWSAPSVAVAVPATPPGAPSGLTAQAGDGEVALSWTAPTDDGGTAVAGYAVRVFEANSETPLATQSTPDAGTTFTVTGLTNGMAYQFDVAAINAQGTGAPSAKSAPVAPLLVCGAGLWLGEYFASNVLGGTATERCDAAIDFDWGTASPIPGTLPADNFSVRWTTSVAPADGVTWRFDALADDGIRVKVDSTWILDGWKDQGPTAYQGQYTFDGQPHTVTVEYYEKTGGARAKLTMAPGTCDGWSGAYYPNNTLTGTPTLIRCEGATLDKNWTAAPAAVLPADNFSVRWTTSVAPADGVTWRFDALADDGIRVKVDTTWILDGWKDQGPTAYQGQYTFDGQPHTVTVEYYEKTGGARAKLTMAPGTCDGWSGAYYPNNTLTGTPTLIRCEGATLDKNWTAAPAAVLPADNFSVRWTTSVAPADGVTWRFDALADDGIRVKVDSTWIIDGWKDQGPTAYQGQYTFDGQPHTVTVEYYEKTGGARAKLTMAPGACEGWSGAYYPNNSLTGTPTLIRCEGATLDKNWTAAPAAVLPADNFSVRWTTSVAPADGVTWRFDALADDGIRVKVDSTWIIDGWKDQGPTAYQGQYTFDGQPHTVTVEYYEKTGGARAKLSMAPGTCDGWSGAYYPNNTLTGTPTLIRCEGATLDKNWTAAPAAVLPADNFSVRWTTTAAFTAGTYRFDALGDDGIRVFVDQVSASDTPLIDGWKDQSPTAYQGTTALTEGQHTITVEYYEKTGGARARVSWVAL